MQIISKCSSSLAQFLIVFNSETLLSDFYQQEQFQTLKNIDEF